MDEVIGNIENAIIDDITYKFIVYFPSNDYIDIFMLSSDEVTINEFMKYDSPCKKCLIQSMCIKERLYVGYNIKNRGINLRLCEKLKKYVNKNQSLFFPVRLKPIY